MSVQRGHWAEEGGQTLGDAVRFALQCYVNEDLHALVKAAADAAHMSVSQWLKLTVIEALEQPEDEAFRDQVLADLLFTKIALDGWLRTHKDKELRDRVVVAYQRRIREYRERKAAKREGR